MAFLEARPDLVLLCGGKGLRLQQVLDGSPKAMAKIDEAPFIKILVDEALSQGIKRIIFCTGYKSQEIENYFKNHPVYRQHCFFSREEEAMGTGGALKLCLDKIESADFIAINGDSYCEVNYSELILFHRTKQAAATIVVTHPGGRMDGGYISLDQEDKISSFSEKEFSSEVWINAGIYALKKNLFDQMPASKTVSLEKDFLPAQIGKEFYAYKTSSALYDIGTPDRLNAFRQRFKKEIAK